MGDDHANEPEDEAEDEDIVQHTENGETVMALRELLAGKGSDRFRKREKGGSERTEEGTDERRQPPPHVHQKVRKYHEGERHNGNPTQITAEGQRPMSSFDFRFVHNMRKYNTNWYNCQFDSPQNGTPVNYLIAHPEKI